MCKGRGWRGHPAALCRHLHKMKILYWRKQSKTPSQTAFPLVWPCRGSAWGCLKMDFCGSAHVGSAPKIRAPPRSLLFRCLYFKMFLICQTCLSAGSSSNVTLVKLLQLSSLTWEKRVVSYSTIYRIWKRSSNSNAASHVVCYYYWDHLSNISTNLIPIFNDYLSLIIGHLEILLGWY